MKSFLKTPYQYSFHGSLFERRAPRERLVAVRPFDSCFAICEYEGDDQAHEEEHGGELS